MRGATPRWRRHLAPAAVVLAGLGLAIALVIGAAAAYSRNERKLLTEDGRLVAAILRAVPVYSRADLQAAVNLAEGVRHPAAAFRDSLRAGVGPGRRAEQRRR